MDEGCDWANDHERESSETLFLTCVVLWFKYDSGKDEILGLRMTVFPRHSLRFSIGRAIHVEPGSIMLTGWDEKYVLNESSLDYLADCILGIPHLLSSITICDGPSLWRHG